mgnify:CR=1 FL=1
MANPQKEDGGTIIANEIMDALCRFRIPGNVRQIIDAIIRKTYGWNKKEDWIAQSQIVLATGLLKGTVSRELSKAITHKIVIAHDNKLQLNKNYEEWISFSGRHFNPNPIKPKLSDTITDKKVIVNETKVIADETKVIVSEGNKIHYTKDTITKDILSPFLKNPEYLLNIPVEDIPFFKKNLNVNSLDIKRKGEELYNWTMSSKKNRRDNYKLVLKNALIKDFGYTYKS